MRTLSILFLTISLLGFTSCVEDGTFDSDDRLPVLERVMPETGRIGDTILVEGMQLAEVDSVYLNGAFSTLISANSTSLLLVIPNSASSGPVSASNQFGLSLGPEFTIFSDTINSTTRIDSISPNSGSSGDQVKIYGVGFNSVSSNYKLLFNGLEASKSSISDVEIVATVPEQATSGIVSIDNAGEEITGPVFIIVNDPQLIVQSINPDSAQLPVDLQISGQNFGNDINNIEVTVNGTLVSVNSIIDTTLSVSLSENITTGIVSVKRISTDQQVDGPVFTVIPPDPDLIIQSIDPDSAQLPIDLQITGQNFGNDINDVEVRVNGAIVTVNSIVDSTLSVSLSQNVTTGIVSVKRISTDQEADGPVFTVIPPDPDLIVQSINPASGQVPIQVTITGESFGNNISDIEVLVNGMLVSVIAVNNTTISVNLPQNTTTGAVAVRRISTNQEDTGPVFTVLPPDPIISVSTLAGGTQASNLGSPFQIVKNGNGGYYFSDPASHSIKRVSAAGVVSNYAGSGQPGFSNGTGGQASFNSPSGLAIDSVGNLYVADLGNHAIRMVAAGGIVTTLAGTGQPGYADGLALQQAQFDQPGDVAVDGNLLFISDFRNHAIRLLNMQTGTVTTFTGNGTLGFVNGSLSAARFSGPLGIYLDADKNILVADLLNHSIRLINRSSGQVSTVAGTGTSGFTNGTNANAQFSLPYDVGTDANGVIYVADRLNHSIRKIEGGNTSTLAGTGVAGFMDGEADQAQFADPLGLVIVSSTELLICDFSNERIRKITIE
jgi:sugar lactone lactonase YvrE